MGYLQAVAGHHHHHHGLAEDTAENVIDGADHGRGLALDKELGAAQDGHLKTVFKPLELIQVGQVAAIEQQGTDGYDKDGQSDGSGQQGVAVTAEGLPHKGNNLNNRPDANDDGGQRDPHLEDRYRDRVRPVLAIVDQLHAERPAYQQRQGQGDEYQQ